MNRQTYASQLRDNLKHVSTFPGGYARLGKGDGSGTIVASLSERTVYIYDTTAQAPGIVPVDENINLLAINNPALEGWRVRLAYPPYDPNRLYVVGIDTGEGMRQTGGVTPAEQLTRASLFPTATNLMAFRLATDTGFSVYVSPAWYYQPSTGDLKWWAGGTLDLTSVHSALTLDQHQLALICLNAEAGALAHLETTAVMGTDKDFFGISAIDALIIPAVYLQSGAAHLYYVQTGIAEADLYRGDADPRVLFSAAGLLRYSTTNISNPPTDAELDSAFGTPAAVGAGWSIILNDNGGGADEYLVWSDGTNWFFVTGTKAT